jgi:xylose isomerase
VASGGPDFVSWRWERGAGRSVSCESGTTAASSQKRAIAITRDLWRRASVCIGGDRGGCTIVATDISSTGGRWFDRDRDC